ncbi:hypothetical protein [Mycobacterium avium]|uniref:hypothetical protein n=1 Tax=Mycobacterium avium TaxID=1764 RepID=UPI0012DAB51D|nr:hypothetical protein [Mycobacterium avium]MDV3301896.1 hypothetical protein [Mycobacterium avium]
MTDDVSVLREKVAQLLGEPRPRLGHSARTFSSTPIGFASKALVEAVNLVEEASYVEALSDWEQCQNELRSWQRVLDSGSVDEACRRRISAALDGLLMRFAVRNGTAVGLQQALGAACKRAQQIVECCANSQRAIRTAAEVRVQEAGAAGVAAQQSVMAAARADAAAKFSAACEMIQTEAERVLLLHKQTAEISLCELHERTARIN